MANKGQGSVEYLIIVAVVLVIALVVVGLSLFFTGTSGQLTDTEVRTYWSSQVSPIRVVDMQGWYYAGAPSNGEIGVVLQNIGNKPIYLRNIVLAPYPESNNVLSVYGNHSASGGIATGKFGDAGPGFIATHNLSITLAPNEKLNIYMRGNTSSTGYFCSANNNTANFKKYLTLQYDSAYFDDISFTGAKPIQGPCNQIG